MALTGPFVIKADGPNTVGHIRYFDATRSAWTGDLSRASVYQYSDDLPEKIAVGGYLLTYRENDPDWGKAYANLSGRVVAYVDYQRQADPDSRDRIDYEELRARLYDQEYGRY